jgi:hypothetical protein
MNLADMRQWRFPKPFRISRPQVSGKTPVLLVTEAKETKHEIYQGVALKQQSKLVAEIATELWRLKSKMTDQCGEPKEEMRKAYRHVESSLDVLSEAGVEIQSHTGQPYRTGLAVETLAFQPTADVVRETVIETLRPSVYLNNKQIQQGQVIVGTPLNKE